MLQRTGAQRSPSERALERYPMSSSDLFISDSTSDDDVRDVIYRNFNFTKTIEKPFRASDEIYSPNSQRRPPDIQPHQLLHNCTKCTRIRTNPNFRYSSSFCRSKRHRDMKTASDGQILDTSEDEQTPKPRRSFPHHRRRTRPKSQLRYNHSIL